MSIETWSCQVLKIIKLDFGNIIKPTQIYNAWQYFKDILKILHQFALDQRKLTSLYQLVKIIQLRFGILLALKI